MTDPQHTRPVTIRGVGIGHVTHPTAETGCTVVLLPEGTTASREVRGGAPATRELDVLAPDTTVSTVDAVLLAGGSAFGLAAADGVMRRLETAGRGVDTPAGRVPIVPALALFDLAAGDPSVRPTAEDGHAATVAAEEACAEGAPGRVTVGRVGAGTGAYVSQWRGAGGRRPGGIAYVERTSGGLTVGALCAVNAFGDVTGAPEEVSEKVPEEAAAEAPTDSGRAAAGAGRGAPFVDETSVRGGRTHTTLVTVVTNARLDAVGCFVVAQGGHDGLARALTPPHTRFDGDAVVAAATGEIDPDDEAGPGLGIDLVRMLAVHAVAEAIRGVARTD